jgi:hypothetical protein
MKKKFPVGNFNLIVIKLGGFMAKKLKAEAKKNLKGGNIQMIGRR